MPGELSTTIDLDDLGTIIWALRVFGSFAGRVYAAVFEQNHSVWSGLGNYIFMDLALKPKTVVVSNEIRVKTCNKKFGHRTSLRVIPNLSLGALFLASAN
jgi:hypothetical protein